MISVHMTDLGLCAIISDIIQNGLHGRQDAALNGFTIALNP